MRVIIKPLGVVCLVSALASLAFLAFRSDGAKSVEESVRRPQSVVTRDVDLSQLSADGIVYSDGVKNGWDKFGWAKDMNWEDTAHARGGSGSCIRVHPANFEAVYLHHTPLDTTLYDRLTFYVNGGSVGGQILVARMLTPDQKKGDAGTASLTLPPLEPGKWTPITLSLKNFQFTHGRKLGGFWLQSLSNKQVPEFYLDDIHLLHPGEAAPSEPLP